MLVFAGLFGALAYFTGQKKPGIKWSKTYKSSDKIPFGSNALIRIMEEDAFAGKFVSRNLPILQSPAMKTAENVTYFFLTDRLFFDQYETRRLLEFASRGNKIFMCANYFRGNLADTLKIETVADLPFIDEQNGSIDTTDKKDFGLNYVNPHLKNKEPYAYDRLLGYSVFQSFDSTRLRIVAADDSGRAVMLRTPVGKGELFFFSLPDVFSNYYIVNHPSRFFAYKALGLMNNDEIWWDEYYKTANPRNESPFRFFVYNDSLYFAFWIAVWATLFFMFFGMKRQQRPVPVIQPPSNSTLDFVEVVGNVYFNARNHKIIAQEKIQFFLEFVRAKFQVKTENIGEEDLKRISRLSGVDLFKVQELFANIKYIYNVEYLNEAELLQFNKRMEDFYKNNKR